MDRYDILGTLAEGGMGEVLLARATGEHGFRKLVAVKRIRPEHSDDPEFLLRFVTEAKVTVSLSHANIVQVFDLARAGPELFLVMEYVRGSDLNRLVRRARELNDPIPIPVVLHLATEALKGLAFAHTSNGGRGVIHCDLTPSNILLSYSGEVKLADFGIAQAMARRQTSDGRVIGKRGFMSPEQLSGQPLDARTDLFSLGVSLKEALVAAPEEWPPARAPRELVRLIDEATAPDRERRPSTAAGLLKSVSALSWQTGPQLTPPEVGAWVAKLAPPRPELEEDAFGSALKNLLGAAPRTGTHTQSERPRTFVVKPAEGGTTVWEDASAQSAPPRKRGLRVAVAAGAAALLLAGGAAVLWPAAPAQAPKPRLATPVAAASPPPRNPVAAAAPPVVTEPAPPVRAPAARPAPAPRSRAPSPGRLSVYAEPWATVVVDGRRIGTTPLRSLPLAPGPHRLRLEHPSRAPVERRITIVSGKTELVDVELPPGVSP